MFRVWRFAGISPHWCYKRGFTSRRTYLFCYEQSWCQGRRTPSVVVCRAEFQYVCRCHNISVRCGIEGPGVRISVGKETSLFFKTPRPALGPTQPDRRSLSWIMRLVRDVCHAPSLVAEVKNEWSCTSAPPECLGQGQLCLLTLSEHFVDIYKWKATLFLHNIRLWNFGYYRGYVTKCEFRSTDFGYAVRIMQAELSDYFAVAFLTF